MKRLAPRKPAPTAFGALALVAALLLLLAPARASADTYWLDGYEVEVALHPRRAAFILGEPVVLNLTFENRSATDLELLLSGEVGPGWPDDFEVSVVGPDGRTLPRPRDDDDRQDNAYTNSFVRSVRNHPLASLHVAIQTSLDSWAKIDRPGRYTVTYRRGVRVGPYDGDYKLFPGTTKPAVELRLRAEVEVVEGGDERMGKLVEELGARMLECNRTTSVEATTRLAAIRDARVVRHLTEAITKCRHAGIRSTAVAALAKFDTDEALEGLRLAAHDADEDFRTAAAQLLIKNKHPKAWALLLSLRADSYFGVRLMVLNALMAKDTKEARRLIQEMTNDEHPMVRDEALRFLQERATHPPRR